MSPPVDREMIALYLLQELDDRRTAELVKYVAEDPAWAAALREEAEFDVLVGQALDALPPVSVGDSKPVAAEVASGWAGWWRAPALAAALVAAAFKGPVLATAAAVAVMVAVFAPVDEPQPLPDYSLVAPVGGEAVTRGAGLAGENEQRSGEASAERLPQFTVGSAMNVNLAPAPAYAGEIEVAVWLDGALLALTPSVSDKGKVTLDAVFGVDLPILTPGRHRIEIWLAPAGSALSETKVFAQEFEWRDASP